MSVTGIVAALTAEARTLEPLPDGQLLLTSGMGPAAAAKAAQALVAAGARNLLSFGFAGALDPHLAAGTVVLAQTVIDGTGRVHPTFGPWRERLALAADPRMVVGGSLLSVAEPLTSPRAKAQALVGTGACAVDMESFAIGSIALQRGLNFAVARVIIDLAGDTVPRSVQVATGPRGEVRVPRLIWGLVRRPADIRLLLLLAQRYRTALESLRHLAQRGVGWS